MRMTWAGVLIRLHTSIGMLMQFQRWPTCRLLVALPLLPQLLSSHTSPCPPESQDLGPARRAAEPHSRKVMDFGLGNQTQPSLPPSGFTGRRFRHAELQVLHPPTGGSHVYLAGLLEGDTDRMRQRQSDEQTVTMDGEGND